MNLDTELESEGSGNKTIGKCEPEGSGNKTIGKCESEGSGNKTIGKCEPEGSGNKTIGKCHRVKILWVKVRNLATTCLSRPNLIPLSNKDVLVSLL